MVTELKKNHVFDVVIVKKTSFGLFPPASLPKFPAIEIDGTVAFQGCNITREQLAAAIRERKGK